MLRYFTQRILYDFYRWKVKQYLLLFRMIEIAELFSLEKQGFLTEYKNNFYLPIYCQYDIISII